MGLRDLFRRRSTVGGVDPIGMGEDDGDLEISEGGPFVFKQELAEYRWAAQQEAVNVVRRGVDPERWDDGRMAFEFERALAHDHEALRDRLSNYVGQRARDEVRELYALAGDVAVVRDELRSTDEHLVRVTVAFKAMYDEVADDELELGRYHRLRSRKGQAVKRLIFAAFVASEFIISGFIFDQVIPTDIPGLGFIFALGVMVLLIVIPHYAAQGLKEGITLYHSFEKKKREQDGEDISFRLARQVHYEDRDDRGFRISASVIGLFLVLMIIAISVVRADELGRGRAWLWFFLFLQLGISSYFFLREWLDHGNASHNLLKLAEQREELVSTRLAILGDLSSAMAEFHDVAEDLIFTLQQAPRWDSYVVETFDGTVRYFRHLITLGLPDYEQFISWARMPYLGSKARIGESGYPLDPVSEEHVSLEEDGPMGREWWLRRSSAALRTRPGSETDGGADDDVSWLATKSPDHIMAEVLDRYFDLSLKYTRPKILDPEPNGGGWPDSGESAEQPVDASDSILDPEQDGGGPPVGSESAQASVEASDSPKGLDSNGQVAKDEAADSLRELSLQEEVKPQGVDKTEAPEVPAAESPQQPPT
jgi:hypothetical protein